MHEDRDHRHFRPRLGEVADALLEGGERLGLAARSFREDDENVAAVERVLACLQWIAALLGAAPRHRNDADDVLGKPPHAAWLGEIIRRGHRVDRVEQAQGQERHQSQRVEMRIVIGGEHRRPLLRQTLAVAHGQAESDEDDGAHHDCEEQEAQEPHHRCRLTDRRNSARSA
jgi:hypothetical protein